MANYFEEKEKLQREQEKYYREKTNLRLRYAALISIGISIMLLLIIAFGFSDTTDTNVLLFMRGCVGLFALLFVVIVGVLVYRVNTSYIEEKAKRSSKRD